MDIVQAPYGGLEAPGRCFSPGRSPPGERGEAGRIPHDARLGFNVCIHLGYKYCNGRMQKQKHTGWPPGVVGWPLGYRTAPLRVPCGSFAMS